MPEPDAIPSTLPDHVDAWWDAFVRSVPPAADPLAPELTGEIRRLHAADRTPHADPVFLARLREDLTMTPTAPLDALPRHPRHLAPPSNGYAPIAPAAPRRGAPSTRRRWWGAVERLVAAVLVVGLTGGYLVLNASTPPSGDEATSADLFLATGDGRLLTRLDSETLETDLVATPVRIPEPMVTEGSDPGDPLGVWTLSADGTTLASVRYPISLVGFGAEKMDVVVRDGLTGPERTRFHPPDLILPNVELSNDGRRILAQRTEVDPLRGFPGTADPPTWYVLDAGSGRTLATIDAPERGPLDDSRSAWLSPDGERLYRLAGSGLPPNGGPDPVRLILYEAGTGNEIDSLDLPDVRAGRWTTERRIGDRPVEEYASVGRALSPDGRRLALLHDEGTVVTLIDTDRLRVERVVRLLPEAIQSRATPMAIATPSAVQRPGYEDPYVQGTNNWAAFTADGSGLYVGGRWTGLADDGSLICDDAETRRIDLRSGGTVARTAVGVISEPLVVGQDGESVYVVGPTGTDTCFHPAEDGDVLRRLDADTLEVLAERDVPSHSSIELIPRLGGGW